MRKLVTIRKMPNGGGTATHTALDTLNLERIIFSVRIPNNSSVIQDRTDEGFEQFYCNNPRLISNEFVKINVSNERER